MLKKMIRLMIIALIQVGIIGGLALWLLPPFLNSASMQTSMFQLLHSSKLYAGGIRVLLYLALFFLWPKAVCFFAKRNEEVSEEQIQSAYKARWIFIGSLLLLEALYWLR